MNRCEYLSPLPLWFLSQPEEWLTLHPLFSLQGQTNGCALKLDVVSITRHKASIVVWALTTGMLSLFWIWVVLFSFLRLLTIPSETPNKFDPLSFRQVIWKLVKLQRIDPSYFWKSPDGAWQVRSVNNKRTKKTSTEVIFRGPCSENCWF